MSLIFVDVEANAPSPSVGEMTEFGAVCYDNLAVFHGKDSSKATFELFELWLGYYSKNNPVFVSDNPAFDWQWINYYFWLHLRHNPFGHSARRIGDFYAGLRNDFHKSNEWKKLRITKHDHNPVNDAMGNVEAFRRMVAGER